MINEERLRWAWILLFHKERPDTPLAFTTKICVLLCLSRRVSQNLEPTIIRIELRMEPSVLDTCLLHGLNIGWAWSGRPWVLWNRRSKRRIEDSVVGCAKSKRASLLNELKNCYDCAKSRKASLLNEVMNLFLAVSNLEGQPIEKKYERRRVIPWDKPACWNKVEYEWVENLWPASKEEKGGGKSTLSKTNLPAA